MHGRMHGRMGGGSGPGWAGPGAPMQWIKHSTCHRNRDPAAALYPPAPCHERSRPGWFYQALSTCGTAYLHDLLENVLPLGGDVPLEHGEQNLLQLGEIHTQGGRGRGQGDRGGGREGQRAGTGWRGWERVNLGKVGGPARRARQMRNARNAGNALLAARAAAAVTLQYPLPSSVPSARSMPSADLRVELRQGSHALQYSADRAQHAVRRQRARCGQRTHRGAGGRKWVSAL